MIVVLQLVGVRFVGPVHTFQDDNNCVDSMHQ